jgi:hypothetical protein
VYAASIAGSERELAVRMKVPIGLLTTWLSGIEEVPASAFLAAVDVIVAATPEEISRSRTLLNKHGTASTKLPPR